MHVLGGMTKPTAGKVLIEGKNIAGMTDNDPLPFDTDSELAQPARRV